MCMSVYMCGCCGLIRRTSFDGKLLNSTAVLYLQMP